MDGPTLHWVIDTVRDEVSGVVEAIENIYMYHENQVNRLIS